MAPTLQTRRVLAGAVTGRNDVASTLTHTVRVDADGETVLCRRVLVDNLVDRFADPAGLTKQPTCTECARRDPRFTTKVR